MAGWARLDAEVPELTPDGEIAVSLARQYRYPVMYLPLLRQVPELIFGEPPRPMTAARKPTWTGNST